MVRRIMQKDKSLIDPYHLKLLKIIKRYDPEEYNDLMNCPYGGIVEDHLDHLAKSFSTLEEFEEAMKQTKSDLEMLEKKT